MCVNERRSIANAACRLRGGAYTPAVRFGVALVWAGLTGPVVALLLEAPHAAWAAMLGYHVGCALVAAGLRARWGPRPRALVLLAWVLGSAALVFGTGCVVVPAMLPAPVLDRARGVVGGWGMDAARAPWMLAYYVLVNPGVEEWFWRSTLLTAAGNLGAAPRRALAVLAFVPFHGVVLAAVFGTAGLLWMLIGIAAAGAIWTWLQIRCDATWVAGASHLGADAGVVLLYLRFLAGP